MRDMPVRIIRNCSVCGRELRITVYEDGRYDGGHYFGKIPVPKGAVVSEWKEKIGELEITVVEHESYEKVEYWECDECYSEN